MNVFTLIFTSRKVWIALAALAGVIVTVLGADPEKWTPLIASIVTLATTVIAAIGYEDGKEKGAGTELLGPPPPASGVSGRVLQLAGVLFVGAFLFVGGCTTRTPLPDYVAADRQTHDVIAPAHAAYVAADPTLTAEQKTRRQRVLDTWRMRIESEEKLNPPAAVTNQTSP